MWLKVLMQKKKKPKQKKGLLSLKSFTTQMAFFKLSWNPQQQLKKKRTLAKMRTKRSTADSWSRYCNIQYCAKMLTQPSFL